MSLQTLFFFIEKSQLTYLCHPNFVFLNTASYFFVISIFNLILRHGKKFKKKFLLKNFCLKKRWVRWRLKRDMGPWIGMLDAKLMHKPR